MNSLRLVSLQGAILLIGGFIVSTLFQVLASVILAWPLELIWNSTMPALLRLPAITFWQAFGLQMLMWLLFGTKFKFESSRS